MKTFKKLFDLLSPHERRRAGLLVIMILVMALLDVMAVASIMPFMAVLASPQLVETNVILKVAYDTLGFTDSQSFLFALGILMFVLLFGSLAFKALTTYVQTRFSMMRECSIGRRLMENYLHQPYSWLLNRHGADMGKTVLGEVRNVIENGMLPMMNLIAHSAVSFALLTLLLLIDPILALSTALVLGLVYGLIFKVFSEFLSRIGAERLKANRRRFEVVNDAFGARKEVKINGLERYYTQRFAEPAETFARHSSMERVIRLLPRYVLEAFVFGGMFIVLLYLIAQRGNISAALPVITTYAFAGYRIIPALQNIYAALSQMRFSDSTLNVLHNDLRNLQSARPDNSQHKLPLNQAITLNNITYNYPNTPQPALNGIKLTIPANSTVGFVGTTGSGKTTVVDLIIGLLEAQQGTLEIDGKVINKQNCRAWQRSIGYVPQQIYLVDDTVAANIAFGVNAEDINHETIERVAKIAKLHEFVTCDLPKGYDSDIGEHGVRLSGGQRQRIGIARALYHNPQVLVLDEASSSLDKLTEQAVMESVHNLKHEITIILVAHRLSTIKDCDKIFLLEKGELTGQGCFDELTQTNRQFGLMAAESTYSVIS